MAGRLPLPPDITRGPAVTITVEGRDLIAYTGETVAAALMAEGVVALRHTPGGAPRGVFCGMGVCFDCLAIIDGLPNTRTCTTWVRDGLEVRFQNGWSPALPVQGE
jgi:predicted molibdopterin-dependent oxidoreductase YjgC